jgi:uncharacterized protein YjiS (DUF1127 family)
MLRQFKRWLDVRRTCHELQSQSDRQLADIGIMRADIPALARGLDPADPDAGRSLVGRTARAAFGPLRDYLDELARQRQVRKELSTYRDDELNEIGIRRADIPAIARFHGTHTHHAHA